MSNYIGIAKVVFTIGKLIYKLVKKKNSTVALTQKELIGCAKEAVNSLDCH